MFTITIKEKEGRMVTVSQDVIHCHDVLEMFLDALVAIGYKEANVNEAVNEAAKKLESKQK